MTSPTPPASDTILFRPSKKRKIYRQRTNADDTDDHPATVEVSPSTTPAPQSLDELIAMSSREADGELEGTQVSMAEILRLRKQRRPKIGGVGFKASGTPLARDEMGTLVVRDQDDGEREEDMLAAVKRFAPQTGTVGDVNKHMMAFIDSRLAQSRLEGLEKEKTSWSTSINTPAQIGGKHKGEGEKKTDTEVQRQPAALGKLMEVDLGNEARDKNVERTNQARRRLDGEEVVEDGKTGKPAKVRLGPDGKPWRSRKKRRGSDDIKRDKMVEDVLRENRLEIYDELPAEPTTINDDQAADDRIAEAFRREFMDAVSQRQMKKVGPPQAPPRNVGGKKDEAELKGPKLGGTRNQRAAMREALLKEAAAKKK